MECTTCKWKWIVSVFALMLNTGGYLAPWNKFWGSKWNLEGQNYVMMVMYPCFCSEMFHIYVEWKKKEENKIAPFQ